MRTQDRHRLDVRVLSRPKLKEGNERRNPRPNIFDGYFSESVSLLTGVSERGCGHSRGRILTVEREDTQGRGEFTLDSLPVGESTLKWIKELGSTDLR